MKKKAQIESIGLVMIVIVLAIALVFALAFFTKQQPKLNEEYLQAQANAALSALLATQPEGCSTTFQQELAACATSQQPLCIASCQDLQKLLPELLTKALPTTPYQFSTTPESIFSTPKITCLNKFNSPEHFLSPEITITLELCYKDTTKK